MTPPPQRVRELTYLRDGRLCVSCGTDRNLTWQHREASGSGGRGSKAPPLTCADGVTACFTCNGRFEFDLQARALRMGWKLRRNRLIPAEEVPYFDCASHAFWLPDRTGGRGWVDSEQARLMIALANSLDDTPEGNSTLLR